MTTFATTATGGDTDGSDDVESRDADGGALRQLARGSGVLGGLSGVGGALWMLGAFGPVSCWTSRTTVEGGGTTVDRGCSAGIDYLFGAGGNAPVLFFWSVALLAFVAVGTWGSWTERPGATWVAAVLCAIVTIVGVFSIGWFFLAPAICYLTAAIALTIRARSGGRERSTTF